MTRKRCKRTIRRLVAPTCVAMILNPEVSLQERGAVLALRGGWATTDHFNVLADCRDMLLLAAKEKDDQSAVAACDLAGVALMNLRDRHTEKGRMGATGDARMKKQVEAMVALADLTRAGFIAGDISTVMSPRTVITWAENARIFGGDVGFAFRLTFLNKCDEVERATLAEYYQRCFGKELPAGSAKGAKH